MATPKKTTTSKTTSQTTKSTRATKASPAPVVEPVVEQPEKQSQFATILIGLLIIASGLLIYNFFQSANQTPTTTQDSTQTSSPTPTPTPAASDDNQTATEGHYTVQAGDSLWSIAEQVYGSGFDWPKIAAANELSTDARGRPTVTEGQVLVVPDSAASTSADSDTQDGSDNTNADNNADANANTEAGNDSLAEQVKVGSASYTVVTGDTLWDVAEQVYGDGHKWTIIYNDSHNRLGQLPNGQVLIHVGNVLYLPQAP